MGACRLYVVPKLTLHFTMYDEALLELLALSAAARAQHCWFTEVVEQTPLVWRDTPCCERAPWWASHNHCDGSRFFRRPHSNAHKWWGWPGAISPGAVKLAVLGIEPVAQIRRACRRCGGGGRQGG